jgi:diguanylate cyclase (GGDEF)-like protein/PAS domain S-box-containing protein
MVYTIFFKGLIMMLSTVYDVVQKNKNHIMKEWLGSESVITILKSIKIDKDLYEKEIAYPVLNYFLGVITKDEEIGDCPAMSQLVETFLDSGLYVEDVFLNCAILKNVIVETLFENSIKKDEIRNATTILDTNLHRVLGIYTKKRVAKDKKYSFDAKLMEEHVSLSITDMNGIIIYVTDAFCTLTGYTADELLGKSHKIIRHPDMSESFFAKMWEKLNSKHTWSGKIKNRKKDGGEFIAKTEIVPFLNEEGEVVEYVAIRHDITDKELSNIDPLTNLYNRRYYRGIITEILQKPGEISLMIIDIDHFKKINDKHGHNFGDLVLKEFAKILTKKIRAQDVCIRWGGEEFVILLPDTFLKKATEIAERIRQSVDALIILDNQSGESADVKCSIGVTQCLLEDNESSFFNRADLNLYSAKKDGRNRVVSK